MTSRKAATYANKVYAAMAAKQITPKEGLRLIERVSPHFDSQAQMHKELDLAQFVRCNPELAATHCGYTAR